MTNKLKPSSKIYIIIVMLFMYLPIFMLAVLSFNSSNSTSVMSGVSIKWYIELFKDQNTLQALYNTLVLAVTSALAATLIGTLAAVGIDKMKKGFVRTTVESVTDIPCEGASLMAKTTSEFCWAGSACGVRR